MRKKRHAKWLVTVLMVAGFMFPTFAMAEEVMGVEAGSGAAGAVSVTDTQEPAVLSTTQGAAPVTRPQATVSGKAMEASVAAAEGPRTSDVTDGVAVTPAVDAANGPATGLDSGTVEPSAMPEGMVQAQEEGGDSNAEPVRAPLRAEQSGVITNIEALLQDGSGPVGDVEQWQVFRLNAEFALPDGQVHAGDTTTITLPDKLRFDQTAGFEIKDSAGNVVANAVIDGAAKTITLTYTDYPENHSDVSGSFYFYVKIDRNNVDGEETIPLVFDVSGETVIGGDIHFIGIGDPTPRYMNKSGYQVGTDGRTLRFQITVNTKQEAIQNVVITDQLGNPGITIDPASIRILKGTWASVHGDWNLQNGQDVTGDYTVTVSDDGTSFTVDLGDIEATDGFLIHYDAIASYDFTDGEIIRNRATMTGDSIEPVTVSATATYYEAGGSAEGYVFTIKVKKVGEDGSALAGARFDVIRVSNGATVGSITTDANGEGSLSGLLRDSYQLIETAAPAGYVVSTTTFDVSSDDFGPDKVATVTVDNELEKTSLTVAKTWVGPGVESVTVHLVIDGEEQGGVQLNADNGWQHIYTDLPRYDTSDGHEIAYTVVEDPLAGYATEITGSAAEGYLITNTNTQTIDIPVAKTWVGTAAGPVTIHLFADGIEITTIELNADSGWATVFEGLRRYDDADGHAIAYTVEEDPVPGYTSSVSGDASNGFVFVNTADTPPEPDRPYPPAAGKENGNPPKSGFSKSAKPSGSLVKTGDGTQAFVVSAALLAVAVALIAAGVVRRRKEDVGRHEG